MSFFKVFLLSLITFYFKCAQIISISCNLIMSAWEISDLKMLFHKARFITTRLKLLMIFSIGSKLSLDCFVLCVCWLCLLSLPSRRQQVWHALCLKLQASGCTVSMCMSAGHVKCVDMMWGAFITKIVEILTNIVNNHNTVKAKCWHQ